MRFFGDDWLELHDFLNTLTINEQVEAELNTNAGFILPNELAYYLNSKKHLIDTIKCVREIKNEPDSSKHAKILEKYNKKPMDISPKSYIR